MKRKVVIILCILSALIAAVALMKTAAFAETDGDYEYSVDANGNATVTGYVGAGGDIDIPSSLGGYPVTAIGKDAFYENNTVTSVTIPEGVTSIGNSAFWWCGKLAAVTMPSTLESIGNTAFQGCNKLERVNVASLASWCAVSFCDDSSNPLARGSTFDKLYVDNVLVHDLVIPGGVTCIGRYAFYRCAGLTSVTILDGVTSIGDNAFDSCTSIASVTIPDSVESIGDCAFEGCTSLTSVTIGNGVTGIGDNAFFECTGLTSLTIPNGVTSIGDDAFCNCTSLTDVYYVGSETEWDGISKGANWNNNCPQITMHYNIFTYTVDGGEATVTGYNGPGGVVSIPSSLGGNPVTAIGSGTFLNNQDITGVVIPEGVTSIGNSAFWWCGKLAAVTMPSTLESIGNTAFQGCNKLERVNVASIASWCAVSFCDDSSNPLARGSTFDKLYVDNVLVHDLVIPGGVTCIGRYAFYRCAGLTSVTIPDGVTSIGDNAFDSCTSIASVTIPDSVESIGDCAFEGCTSLTWVTFGNGVTSIGDNAFFECTGLTSLTIPNGVTSIGNRAFESCTSLASVTIGNGVTSIGDCAFEGCTSLSWVTFGNGVDSIGEYAFIDCTSLTDVYYVGSETEWDGISKGANWNKNCPQITMHYNIFTYNVDGGEATVTGYNGPGGNVLIPSSLGGYPVTAIGSCTFLNNQDITGVVIPEGVTSIGYSAFSNCGNIAEITMPSTLESVGFEAFGASDQLERVNVASIASWCAVSFTDDAANPLTVGSNYDKLYVGGELVHNLVIPYGVTSIGNYAFYKCAGLTSVTIPDGVTSIGDNAFDSCTSIASVTIPDSVESIGVEAFAACLSLSSVKIPDGLTAIGDYAFRYCEGLTSVTVPDSVTAIGDCAFEGCTSLSWVTFGNGVDSIGEYAFCDCTSLTDVYYVGSETEWDGISKGAHWNDQCPQITMHYNIFTYNVDGGEATVTGYNGPGGVVSIPSSLGGNPVTAIGDDAFKNKHGITVVTIPEGVTEIGANAFSYCNGLTTVTIPSTLESVGEHAFYGYGNLERVNIASISAWCAVSFCDDSSNPLSLGDLSDKLYVGGKPVHDLVIPDGVTGIGKYAFINCTGITTVTLPSTLTTVGVSAFAGCENIEKVNIADTDGWQAITFGDAYANPVNVGADCDILYIGDELVPAFEVSTWEGLYAALGRGGCFKLTADAVPGNPYWADALVVPDGVKAKLDLNGHIVDRGYTEADYDGSVIKIFGGTLTISDSAPEAEHKVAVPATDPVEYADAVTYVDPISNNTVAVKGGIITGGFTEQYGGVYVFNGVLNFEGGTIVGNGAGKKKNSVEGVGGGVFIQNGTFNMSGGAIVGNKAYNIPPVWVGTDPLGKGGGVFVANGTFNMSGGIISGNEAGEIAGGVYIGKDGTFNMTAGMIFGNVAPGNNEFPCANNIVNKGGNVSILIQLTLDPNYTGGDIMEQMLLFDVKTTIAACTFTREGYTFQGWATQTDGSGTQYSDGAEITLSEPLTLYAKWKAEKYTITFKNEDGTVLQTCSVDYDSMPAYAGETPTKDSSGNIVYTFVGWTPSVTTVKGEAEYTAKFGIATDSTCDECGSVLYIDPDASTDDNHYLFCFNPNCTECGVQAAESAHSGTASCGSKAVCTVCGVEFGDVDANNHVNKKHIPAVDATCTKGGNIEHWYCSDCGNYYSDAECTHKINFNDTQIPKKDHGNKVYFPAVDATCTEDGNIEYWYCPDCSIYYSNEECTNIITLSDAVTEKTGHADKEHIPSVDATCTEDGNIEYWYCPDCGIYYSDEACTTAVEQSDTIVKAKGHEWDGGSVTTPATCTEDGVITYKCKHDASHFYTETVKAKGHTPGEPVVENEIAATCTEEGSCDLVTYCSVCGAELERTTVRTEALGHDFWAWAETPATCTEDGFATRVCSRDPSHIETRVIAAKGHIPGSPVTENEVAATCTEAGSHDLVTYCAVCGAELERTTVRTEALGHDYGEWTVTAPATCTEDGVETRVCSRDPSHYETRGIAAKGHIPGSPVTENEVAATCTEAGSHDLVTYCAVCGAELERTTVRTEALGHDYGEWTVTAPATCTEDGVETRVCSRDPSHYETRGIPATGHLFGNWSVKVEPTETEAGLKVRVCSVCGMEETEAIPALGESGKIEYEFKVEPEKEWKAESGNDFVLISVADFSTFIGAKVDGSYLDSRYYVAEEGSTKVTFKAEYLETLPSGDHTLSVVSEDGEATAVVSIIASSDTPDIPDVPDVPDIPETTDAPEVPGESGKSPVVWIIVAAVGVAAIAVATVIVVKKRKAK